MRGQNETIYRNGHKAPFDKAARALSMPLPLSAQGNSDKTDGVRLAAALNLKPENIRPLLSCIMEGTIPASQEDDEQVGVVPEWGARPSWAFVRSLGVRDDGQPNAVTS